MAKKVQGVNKNEENKENKLNGENKGLVARVRNAVKKVEDFLAGIKAKRDQNAQTEKAYQAAVDNNEDFMGYIYTGKSLGAAEKDFDGTEKSLQSDMAKAEAGQNINVTPVGEPALEIKVLENKKKENKEEELPEPEEKLVPEEKPEQEKEKIEEKPVEEKKQDKKKKEQAKEPEAKGYEVEKVDIAKRNTKTRSRINEIKAKSGIITPIEAETKKKHEEIDEMLNKKATVRDKFDNLRGLPTQDEKAAAKKIAEENKEQGKDRSGKVLTEDRKKELQGIAPKKRLPRKKRVTKNNQRASTEKTMQRLIDRSRGPKTRA